MVRYDGSKVSDHRQDHGIVRYNAKTGREILGFGGSHVSCIELMGAWLRAK